MKTKKNLSFKSLQKLGQKLSNTLNEVEEVAQKLYPMKAEPIPPYFTDWEGYRATFFYRGEYLFIQQYGEDDYGYIICTDLKDRTGLSGYGFRGSLVDLFEELLNFKQPFEIVREDDENDRF